MPSIIPAAPGVAVRFTDVGARRFADPNPANVFVVSTFDRGSVAQAAGPSDLITKFGARQNYSVGIDSTLTSMAESGSTHTISRVVGEDAVAASVVLGPSTAATVTAKSAGDWANGATGGLKAQVADAGGGTRRIVITLDDVTVATSPATDDIADLISWSDDQDYVTVTGTALPAVAAAASLAGGDDDRENITPADYGIALDRLEKRYGPGILYIPGVTDDEVHQLAIAHGKEFNRTVRLDLEADVTKADALTYALGMQSDIPDDIRYGGTWASYAYTRPIAGEPERLVPWSAVQAGIDARIRATEGPGAPPFGPRRGAARTVTRLPREWSDADRHELYAAGINVATDDGTSFSSWGYRTLDLDELQQDLHHQNVRVSLRWDCENLLTQYIAEPIDRRTLASLAGQLEGLCQAYQVARALYGDEADPGYAVDVDGVNTLETMQARELHAALRIRQTTTADWVDLTISVAPITQTL